MLKKALGLITILIVLGFAYSFFYLEKKIAERKVSQQLFISDNFCLNLYPQCLLKKGNFSLTLFCHSGSNYHFSKVEQVPEGLEKGALIGPIQLFKGENRIFYQSPELIYQMKATDPKEEEFSSFEVLYPCTDKLQRLKLSSGQN